MLGETSSNTINHTPDYSNRIANMSSRKIYPCNTCNLVFEESQAQRTHMREPWHVYNLKRRMASLPAISSETYAGTVATSLVSNKLRTPKASGTPPTPELTPSIEGHHEDDNDELDDAISEHNQADCCLFCTKKSDNLETNLEHMSSKHSLYIPEVENLSSLETMIRYLHTVITEYNECLYCGTIKQSAEGARRHMLDKGHCMLNLEREPELLEFWELSDSDGDDTDDEDMSKAQDPMTNIAAPRDMFQNGITLPSGKIVEPKSKARATRLFHRRIASAARESSNPMSIDNPNDNAELNPSTTSTDSFMRSQSDRQDRTVALRNAAGLIGVSDQQVRSLVTVERKMQRQQAIVQASAGWADEKGGTHQKHYKVKMNLRAG